MEPEKWWLEDDPFLLGASLFLGGELLNFRGVTMCWNDLLGFEKKNDALSFLPICRWHHYIIHFSEICCTLFFPRNHKANLYVHKNHHVGWDLPPHLGSQEEPLHNSSKHPTPTYSWGESTKHRDFRVTGMSNPAEVATCAQCGVTWANVLKNRRAWKWPQFFVWGFNNY